MSRDVKVSRAIAGKGITVTGAPLMSRAFSPVEKLRMAAEYFLLPAVPSGR